MQLFERKKIDVGIEINGRSSKTLSDPTHNPISHGSYRVLDIYMEHMERFNIDRAVMLQPYDLDNLKQNYRQLTAMVLKSQKKIMGFGIVPPIVKDINYYIDLIADTEGLVGTQVNTLGGPRDPFDVPDITKLLAFPVWKKAEELNLIVWLNIHAGEVHLLPYLLEKFKKVNVVIGRASVFQKASGMMYREDGAPILNIKLPSMTKFVANGLSRYKNLYIVLSGYDLISHEGWPYEDIDRWHQPHNMVQTFGSKQLMWGGDFPWTYYNPGYAKTIAFLEHRLSKRSQQEMSSIFYGTAYNLFGFS